MSLRIVPFNMIRDALIDCEIHDWITREEYYQILMYVQDVLQGGKE